VEVFDGGTSYQSKDIQGIGRMKMTQSGFTADKYKGLQKGSYNGI
jgi:hypothetical protein